MGMLRRKRVATAVPLPQAAAFDASWGSEQRGSVAALLRERACAVSLKDTSDAVLTHADEAWQTEVPDSSKQLPKTGQEADDGGKLRPLDVDSVFDSVRQRLAPDVIHSAIAEKLRDHDRAAQQQLEQEHIARLHTAPLLSLHNIRLARASILDEMSDLLS
ncbi:MAG: hypothetical protein MHM6MM_000606 [Cercozoa sp. M6MM]